MASGRRGRSNRLGDRLVLAVAGLIVLVGFAGALDLTLIPWHLDDEYVGLTGSNDGPAYGTIYTREHGAMPTFSVVIERAGGRDGLRGQHLHKEPWSRTMWVGGREVDLTPPTIVYEYVAMLGLAVGVAMLRWTRRPRAGDG